MILKTLLEKTLIPFLSISFAGISIGFQERISIGFKNESNLHLWPFAWRGILKLRIEKVNYWICQEQRILGFLRNLGFYSLPQTLLSRQEDLLHSGEKPCGPSDSVIIIFLYRWVIANHTNNESVDSILGARICGESINDSSDLIIGDTLDRVEVSKRIRLFKRRFHTRLG